MPNKNKGKQTHRSGRKDPDPSPATLVVRPGGGHHDANPENREAPHLQASSSSVLTTPQGTALPPGYAAEEGQAVIQNKVEQTPGNGSAPSSSSSSSITPPPRQGASRIHLNQALEPLASSFGLGSCAERTRSKNPNPTLILDRGDREAVFLAEDKKKGQTPSKKAGKSTAPEAAGLSREVDPTDSATKEKMSRNRPRGAPAGDNAEEVNLWNKVIHEVTRAKELNDKQKDLGQQIAALDEKIAKGGSKPTLAEINQLDDWHRQLLKLSEQEKKILSEEPSNAINNLGLLVALRSHSESNATSGKHRKRKPDTTDGAADSPAPSTAPVSDKVGRLKSATHRSTSVSSSRAREGEASEGTKGTVAEKGGQLFVGAEVVFKHRKQHGMEGEGIQCIIKNIIGEGNKKRYDVQDPEPIENGEEGAVYKTTATSLIPIPKAGTSLPSFPAGKQVLARYPDTTTFYRAEVVGSKKDFYRLRFEGEEDDKEMEVDRRFVLDIPGNAGK